MQSGRRLGVVLLSWALTGTTVAEAAVVSQCESQQLFPPVGFVGAMGYSGSLADGHLLAGAPFTPCTGGSNCGAAHLFRFTGSSWVAETSLTAADAAQGNQFGSSVSISGLVAFVGAPGIGTPGAVYVHRSVGTGNWPLEVKLTFAGSASFGRAVSVSGNVAVVGSYTNPCLPGTLNCGVAHVYRFNGTSWQFEASLHQSDPQASDRFAEQVAIDGDVVAVTELRRRALYMFRRTGGVWSQQARLTGSGTEGVGDSVAVLSDRVLVGAVPESCGGGPSCGAAYVFRYNGASWVQETRLAAAASQAFDFAGSSVDLSTDFAIIGAPGRDCAGGVDCGGAFVFRRTGTTWAQELTLAPSDAIGGDILGSSVGVDGSWLAVGAPSDDGFATGAGAAYFFPTAVSDCNNNGNADRCDVQYGGIPDCNANQVPDACDIAQFTSADCNNNGVPDECQGNPGGSMADCNNNGRRDVCDIRGGFSSDCNNNGIPDECIGPGNEADCNLNLVPDACDIAGPVSEDCEPNGIPDECETFADCNLNATNDECDIQSGLSDDCNDDTVPDECQGPQPDCNSNGVGDGCDVRDHTSDDCNINGVPDECEPAGDCNNNQVLDLCDIGSGTSDDCNANSIPDECDIAGGTSLDGNGDGRPDECCPLATAAAPEFIDANPSELINLVPLRMNRYLAFRPGNAGRLTAVRVRFDQLPVPWSSWNGTEMWLTAPQAVCENAGVPPGGSCPGGTPTFRLAGLTCNPAAAAVMDWSTVPGGLVYVTHPGIVPQNRFVTPGDAVYQVQVIVNTCNRDNESNYSNPLEFVHSRWGDVVGKFDSTTASYVAPDDTVTIVDDVVAVLNKFANRAGSPVKGRADVEPCITDGRINITDVTRVKDAFSNIAYPWVPGSGGCPPDPCGALGR